MTKDAENRPKKEKWDGVVFPACRKQRGTWFLSSGLEKADSSVRLPQGGGTEGEIHALKVESLIMEGGGQVETHPNESF